MTTTPTKKSDVRHDTLRDIVQALARVTYPPGKHDGTNNPHPSETGISWWNRVLRLAGVDVFLPDSEDQRFREFIKVWQHCIEKQAERCAAWDGKIETWFPVQPEIFVIDGESTKDGATVLVARDGTIEKVAS